MLLKARDGPYQVKENVVFLRRMIDYFVKRVPLCCTFFDLKLESLKDSSNKNSVKWIKLRFASKC